MAGIEQRMEGAAGWRPRALRRFAGSRRRCERIARAEDGSTLIEFTLATMGMMTFTFVLMQLCLAFYSAGRINEIARETTRWAITRGSTCQTAALASCTTTVAAIGAYATGLKYPNLAGGTMTVDTVTSHMLPDTYTPPGNGTPVVNCMTPAACRVKVAITYTVPITLPLVPKNSIALSTVSEMYFIQ